ncbi:MULTISPECIES: NADPH-dependent F420 reductase [Streptomyces]
MTPVRLLGPEELIAGCPRCPMSGPASVSAETRLVCTTGTGRRTLAGADRGRRQGRLGLAQGQETRMKIGIIGAGNIGGTLTRRLTALGHEVAVANSRGPQTLADLASETGARAVSVSEVAPGADLVIVTIPEIRVPDLPSGLFQGVPDNLIVVDTGNYYPRQRDGEIREIEAGLPESRWVERQLHHPVIKAFNNIYAQHLAENGRPAGTPGRIALPVAGDDPRAKAVVMDLVDELGFDAVDTGGLDESWRQQPGSPVYTTDKDAEGVKRALADADRHRTPDWQATPDSPGTFEAPA